MGAQSLSMQWMETHVVIPNRLGLHARPAMSFVDTASGFNSDIVVQKEGQEVDAKSIMHVMMLAAGQGTHLKIRARGDDAEEALRALSDLIDRNFDEDE